MQSIKTKKSICRNEDSIWLATTPTTDYPSLFGNKKIDIDTIVIGGGIAGISTALLLKQAGINVVLIESGSIAKGVSGYTSGKITSQHILIYRYLIDKFGFEMAKQYADANQEAIEKIADLIKANTIECDFFRKTAYTYAETDKTMDKLVKEADAAKSLGLPAYAEEKVPIPIPSKGAVCFLQQAQFHPRKYLLRLAEMIPGQGSAVYEKTRATGIKEYSNSRFLVSTNSGDITAKNVVISTNFPFYDKPGQYYARMEAGRIYSFAIKLNSCFPDGIFISAEKDVYSFRSQPYNNEELIIAGGQEHITGEVEDTMSRFENLFEYVSHYFDIDHVEFCWSSQDANTLDMVPYIGRYLPDKKNIFIATGFNGWGMTHGTIAAMIIKDMIIGVKNPWASIYDPARFKLKPRAKTKKSIAEADQEISKIPNNAVNPASSGETASYGKPDPYIKIYSIKKNAKFFKDLSPGSGKIAEIYGVKVAIYKGTEKDGYFLKPLCPHMGCLLRFNVAEKSWDCPCHGSRFSYNGKVLNSPAFEDLEILSVFKNIL